MLKKSASFVLAALRGSTYRSVRLASSFAAALLDGIFEHPAWYSPLAPGVRTSEILACLYSFSAACLSFGNASSVESPDVLTNPLRPAQYHAHSLFSKGHPKVSGLAFSLRVTYECRQ